MKTRLQRFQEHGETLEGMRARSLHLAMEPNAEGVDGDHIATNDSPFHTKSHEALLIHFRFNIRHAIRILMALKIMSLILKDPRLNRCTALRWRWTFSR
jgi:hypothetical protein